MPVIRGIWRCLGSLLILRCLLHQVMCSEQEDSSNYYTAAVVEFTPTYKGGNGTSTLRENCRAYMEYVALASQQNADIIVFPEDGLTSLYMPDRSRMDSWATVIPSPVDNYVPCIDDRNDNVSETLKKLSCAARQHRIYVVVNIAEKEFCQENGSTCKDGVSYHNTNVVFDRTGKIIARYRKVHLYMEFAFDVTETPEIVTFDTDFGVTFGTFVCFDILFWEPALNLTRSRGISNFVYTTAWFSETPFLTAVQTQFGWSFAENANLLVSGYHEPKNGNAGSGIYLGRKGVANATITSFPKHRLLISRVSKSVESSDEAFEQPLYNRVEQLAEPNDCSTTDERTVQRSFLGFVEKSKKEEQIERMNILRDNLTSYVSVPLNVSMTKKLCHGHFCCDFDVRTVGGAIQSQVRYRAVVYDGVRLYGAYVEAGVRVCALVQCSNDSIHSCGSIESSNTTFTVLNIATTTNDYSTVLVMPSVLDSALLPIEHFAFNERSYPDAAQTHLSIVLNRPTKNLLTFGLYVRNFAKDKQHQP